MSEIKMVVTDLDGTLLQTDHTISPEDTETLIELGCLDVCRVAATGRNLFKVRQVLTPETPFELCDLLVGRRHNGLAQAATYQGNGYPIRAKFGTNCFFD